MKYGSGSCDGNNKFLETISLVNSLFVYKLNSNASLVLHLHSCWIQQSGQSLRAAWKVFIQPSEVKKRLTRGLSQWVTPSIKCPFQKGKSGAFFHVAFYFATDNWSCLKLLLNCCDVVLYFLVFKINLHWPLWWESSLHNTNNDGLSVPKPESHTKSLSLRHWLLILAFFSFLHIFIFFKLLFGFIDEGSEVGDKMASVALLLNPCFFFHTSLVCKWFLEIKYNL